MKILTLILILFLPLNINAFMLIGGGTPVSGTCSTPDSGDELDEGFLGVGYENSWVETIGAGDVVDEDFTLSGSPPSNSCSEGLRVDADESNSYTTHTLGSAIPRTTNTDIVCDVYITSFTIDNYSVANFISWIDVAKIEFYNSNGTSIFRVSANGNSSNLTFALNTWYTITLHLDAVAANSYIQCSGCTDETQKTFTRLDTVDGSQLRLGYNNLAIGEDIDSQFGYCYINTP